MCKEKKHKRYVLKYNKTGGYYKNGPIGLNCLCTADFFDCWLFKHRYSAELAGTMALYKHMSSKSVLLYKDYVLLSKVAKKEYKYVYEFNSDLFEVEKIILSARKVK